MAAATALAVVVLAGCDDVIAPLDETLAESELLILGMQAGAPAPPTENFYVVNARATTQSVIHADNFNTLYMRIEFDRLGIASVDGAAVGSSDSVLVVLQPRAGGYGTTISPDGMEFSTNTPARITFSYGAYGDRSVADGNPKYPDREAYGAALEVWKEIAPGRWQRVPGSGPAGIDVIEASLDSPGVYVVAAPQ